MRTATDRRRRYRAAPRTTPRTALVLALTCALTLAAQSPPASSAPRADGSGATWDGPAVKMSLSGATALAAVPVGSAVVQTIDTSQWSPSSPDPSAITYLPSTDRLLVTDAEVEEMPIFAGANLYQADRTGVLHETGLTTAFSSEPSGAFYRSSPATLFVTDDNLDRVFFVRPGTDGHLGTADDTQFSITTKPASTDSEDVAYDSVSGDLFLVDGIGAQVVRVNRGPNGSFGGGDDVVTSFDVNHFGAVDPEGITYHAVRDTLLLVDWRTEVVLELTKQGGLIQIIDISAAGSRLAAGIAVAPGSLDPTQTLTTMWIVDRGVDNNTDPTENDGKIYEMTLPSPVNQRPVVTSVTIDQAAPRTNDTLTVTVTASDPEGDPLTYHYQWVKNGTDLPGATGATLDLSVPGIGDEEDGLAVRVVALDGSASSDPATSAETTVDNSPPGFDQDLVDRVNVEGDVVSVPVGAGDPDGDSLVYEASGLPAGLGIDASSGLISGTIDLDASAASRYSVSVTIRDEASDDVDTFTWAVDPNPAPSAPTGLAATVTSPTITLDWGDNPEPDLAGYNVYRSSNQAGPFDRLNGSLLSVSTYEDQVAPGGTSHYRVTAVDAVGRESTAAETSIRRALDQTISFGPLPDRAIGDPDFELTATASSGLPVSYTGSGQCTVSDVTVHLTARGACSITASQPGDDVYDPAPDVTRSFLITPVSTTTTVDVSPSTVQYSDPVSISAAVSAPDEAPSGSVEFFRGTVSMGTAPLVDGTATLAPVSAPLPKADGYDITAVFTSSDPRFEGSTSAIDKLVVTREDARVLWTGPEFVITPSTSQGNVPVTLSATISDISAVPGDPSTDPNPGAITGAKVTFVNRLTNRTFSGCSQRPVTLVSGADPQVGTATCTVTLNTGGVSKLFVGEYEVGISVVGAYTRNATVDDVVVTIARPYESRFATGGGEVDTHASAGSHPGDPDTTANFGFGARTINNQGEHRGSFLALVRSGGHVYRISGMQLSSFTLTAPNAAVVGPATVLDVTDPLQPVTVFADGTMRIVVTDGGVSGPHMAAFQVRDGSAALWFSSNWNGSATVAEPVTDGGVRVR